MNEQIDRQLHELVQLERASYTAALPSPGLIWWRAQLLGKRRMQRKALIPIRVLRGISVAATYAAVAAVLYIAIPSGAIEPAWIAFCGILAVALHVATLWVYWTFSAKSK